MPQIMQTRSVAIGGAAQTGLSGRRIECSVNSSIIQTITPTRDEQIGRHRPSCPMALAPDDVVCEHPGGCGRQGYQAVPAKLGTADSQHSGLQIDVFKLKIARFAE